MSKQPKKIKWPTTKEESDYLRERKRENYSRAIRNPNENWMMGKLAETGLKWNRQCLWGYRIFDFWNSEKGIVVEVDGLGHDKAWDAARDEYNLRRSGIVVIRVRNRNEADADEALRRIAELGDWKSRRVLLDCKNKEKIRKLWNHKDSERLGQQTFDLE